MKILECTSYLVASKKPSRMYGLNLRMTSKPPRLAVGEVAVRIDVSLPESLFMRPSLSAKISVNACDVPKADISAEVMDNVAAALKEQLGFDVRVSVEEPA